MTDVKQIVADVVHALAKEIAAEVVAQLRGEARTPERVPLADVAAHGAPSRRWVEEQARLKRIELRGPRGARYVLRTEIEALVASSTIRRAARERIPASTTVQEDARQAVVEMVAKRAAGVKKP